jgi:hypothetical protein
MLGRRSNWHTRHSNPSTPPHKRHPGAVVTLTLALLLTSAAVVNAAPLRPSRSVTFPGPLVRTLLRAVPPAISPASAFPGPAVSTILGWAPAPPASTYTGVPLPARGAATAYGCRPALDYMKAYGAPGFKFLCPGPDQGHEATTTCITIEGLCSYGKLITIAVPCPAAYMNEASNSRVLSGLSDAPIDPYGECR